MSKVKQLAQYNGSSWVPYDIDASYLGGIVATNYARINVSNSFAESQTFNKGMIVSGGISCQGTVDVNINNNYSNGAFIYTVTDGVAPMHVIFKMIYTADTTTYTERFVIPPRISNSLNYLITNKMLGSGLTWDNNEKVVKSSGTPMYKHRLAFKISNADTMILYLTTFNETQISTGQLLLDVLNNNKYTGFQGYILRNSTTISVNSTYIGQVIDYDKNNVSLIHLNWAGSINKSLYKFVITSNLVITDTVTNLI